MSLREDLETMQRYKDAGLLKEYLEGTAPRLGPEPMPLDPSAREQEGQSTYEWISKRGD